MDLPKISIPSGGGMLDNVKSRLGFGGQQPRAGRGNDDYYDDGYDDGYYDDGYDDYDGYNGYPDDLGVDDGYDRYGQVTTRPTSSVTPARLVSIDDVRASTQVPSSLNRDPLPARRVTSPSSSSFRTLVNESTPAPNSPADVSRRRERSESLDDLFEPSAASSQDAVGSMRASRSGLGSSPLASVSDSRDSYTSTSSASSASRYSSRSLKVIKPSTYGDMEQVAKILRAGDAAVIVLDNTPADLAKRVLDFSFGVACAMDASVDCISSKVFFIATGAALSDVERSHLRAQGVL